MRDFTLHNPTKVIFGKGSMDQLGENIRKYGTKVLLTYGKGAIKQNGIYAKVMQQLSGMEVREFGGIEQNPRIETLRECIKLAKEFQPDLILAVGGGSTIDGTKLVAVGAKFEGDAWDLVLKKAEPTATIPLASVLTVSATGTEMNPTGVITNWATKEKMAISHPLMYPVFSILDPQNTFSLSARQTSYGIVDIMSHVLEQYLSTTPDVPLQSRFAESILLTVMENGKTAMDDPTNYAARANLMFCSTLALNGLIGSGVSPDWATHGIEHQISAFYDIPHGLGLAIITPRWMQVAYEPKKAKFVQYGKRVWNLNGTDDEIVAGAIRKTYDYFASLGIQMELPAWGITNEHFHTMVERMDGKIGELKLGAAQILTILDNCLVPLA